MLILFGMVDIETVLVLGAGASMPFSFPSGKKLVALINDMLNGDSPTVDLLKKHGHEKEHIWNFRNTLVLSGRSSVDEFLEYRTDFLDIGKEAIAAALLRFEQTANLFNVKKDNNWYQYLFGLLNTSFDEFDQNKLAIITFNYDRSFEHYLFTALQHAYNKNDEECAEKLNKIPIVHLHGKLGRLPWEKTRYSLVPYDTPRYPDKLGLYVGRGGVNIKIIHEDIKKDPEFKQAFELLIAAKRICFLGFGFNETNLKRLRIESLCQPDVPDKDICGTSYGLSQRQLQLVKGYKKTPNRLIDLYSQKIYDFLYSNPNASLG
ncbi:MAG: hypothetical protein FVQ84_00980 [Planctomycetes bacterium]|nr:hypothetical protein [Planctomycetota bacterium]